MSVQDESSLLLADQLICKTATQKNNSPEDVLDLLRASLIRLEIDPNNPKIERGPESLIWQEKVLLAAYQAFFKTLS